MIGISVFQVNVSQVQFESGKMINANKFGKEDAGESKLELTHEEEKMIEDMKVCMLAKGSCFSLCLLTFVLKINCFKHSFRNTIRVSNYLIWILEN